MKFTLLSTAVVLALLSARSVADVDLNPFPTSIVPGHNYTLSWTATANYTYTIWLVLGASGNTYENEFQWTRASTVAQGALFKTLTPSYIWTAPTNISLQGQFALWIDALSIPFTDGESYSNLTAFFEFTPIPASSTSTSTTMTISTMTNTTMATSTMISSSASHSLTSTPTPSSSATSSLSSSASSVPTSGSSSGGATSGTTHHNGLSGGAIAGIVIAILVLIALAIAGTIFYKWRRKRTAFQQREAAARANRLEPVMSEGSYEMQGRPPQAKSETDI